MTEPDHGVDLVEVRRLLHAAIDLIDPLEEMVVPGRSFGRSRTQVLGDVQRGLLFLEHVIEKARVATKDEYFSVRGHDNP